MLLSSVGSIYLHTGKKNNDKNTKIFSLCFNAYDLGCCYTLKNILKNDWPSFSEHKFSREFHTQKHQQFSSTFFLHTPWTSINKTV